MKAVIDSNIVLALTIPLAYSAQATKQMGIWQSNNTQLFVPTLWNYEVITAVRKTVTAKVISPEDGVKAFNQLGFSWVRPLD